MLRRYNDRSDLMSVAWKGRAAALVTLAALLSACASSPTLSGAVNDIGADAELKAILVADRSHDYSDVDLTVYERRLMLTGSVRSEAARAKLVDNAFKAAGIDQVIDEVFVGDRTPTRQGLEDSRIDSAIRAKYLTSGNLRSGNYKMSVSSGVVYLLGVARDQEELDLALKIAAETAGVRSVVSHVTLRTFPGPNGP
jgi:osmotically-inducible protein OsmY